MSEATSIRASATARANMPVMQTVMASMKSTSTPWKGSGRSCAPGYAPIEASRRKSFRSISGSSSLFTMPAREANSCSPRSLVPWSPDRQATTPKPRMSLVVSTHRPTERVSPMCIMAQPDWLRIPEFRFSGHSERLLAVGASVALNDRSGRNSAAHGAAALMAARPSTTGAGAHPAPAGLNPPLSVFDENCTEGAGGLLGLGWVGTVTQFQLA